MTSIPITDILTIIFVLVDDWYQIEGIKFLKGKPGKKPELSDSEVMTLMLAQDFIPFPSETQFETNFSISKYSFVHRPH